MDEFPTSPEHTTTFPQESLQDVLCVEKEQIQGIHRIIIVN
jgi:hypothetical protein